MQKHTDLQNYPEGDVESVAAYLRDTGRYQSLLTRLADSTQFRSVHFEMAFAYQCERAGRPLEYERTWNPENHTTLDFTFRCPSGTAYLFELVCPDESDVIKSDSKWQDAAEGCTSVSAICLQSGQAKPHLRPEAETIRIQEKILSKVDKFPSPSDHVFSIVIVDCSNSALGMWDISDCEIVMNGHPAAGITQYWEGCRIHGLTEDDMVKRGTQEFRARMSAVLFVKTWEFEGIREAWALANPQRAAEHRWLLQAYFRTVAPFAARTR